VQTKHAFLIEGSGEETPLMENSNEENLNDEIVIYNKILSAPRIRTPLNASVKLDIERVQSDMTMRTVDITFWLHQQWNDANVRNVTQAVDENGKTLMSAEQR
jgi:hypothetical protein